MEFIIILLCIVYILYKFGTQEMELSEGGVFAVLAAGLVALFAFCMILAGEWEAFWWIVLFVVLFVLAWIGIEILVGNIVIGEKAKQLDKIEEKFDKTQSQ